MQFQDVSSGTGLESRSPVASVSRLPVRPLTKKTIVIRLLLLLLALTTIYALANINTGGTNLAKAVGDTFANLQIIFLHPGGPRLSFFTALYEVIITLGLAFLSTLLGACIALFL